AQSYPKIVHGVGIESPVGAIALLEDALHPGTQAKFRLRRLGIGIRTVLQNWCGCHCGSLLLFSMGTIVASLRGFFQRWAVVSCPLSALSEVLLRRLKPLLILRQLRHG